jgi:hypothetical protein
LSSAQVRSIEEMLRMPWVLIGLLAANTIPPLVELLNRGASPNVYALRMALFLSLLVLGWALVDPGGHYPRSRVGPRPVC